MPNAKLARILGIDQRTLKRPLCSPTAASEPEASTLATAAQGAVSQHTNRTGWLFLFYDTYVGRTSGNQKVVIRFLPLSSLPPEASAWRSAHAVDGRIVVSKDLPLTFLSKIGALVDLGESLSPPCVVSCVVDATGRDAVAVLRNAESGSTTGTGPGHGVEDDEENDNEDDNESDDDDDEENINWDSS